jgi:hypothetical protein
MDRAIVEHVGGNRTWEIRLCIPGADDLVFCSRTESAARSVARELHRQTPRATVTIASPRGSVRAIGQDTHRLRKVSVT